MLDDGFVALEATDERVSEAELHRSRGLLLAATGDAVGAESSFRAGVEVARHQQALLLELRSTNALASLLVRENRKEEARAVVADVTERFTQGRRTPVFQSATAILSELSAYQ
jgi:streptomycin 6-kinase